MQRISIDKLRMGDILEDGFVVLHVERQLDGWYWLYTGQFGPMEPGLPRARRQYKRPTCSLVVIQRMAQP